MMEKINAWELHRKISFETDDDSMKEEIWEYIDCAEVNESQR